MNILLLGSGGREHAFAWKIKQSPLCAKLYIAPGNAGTLQFGENIDISVNNFKAIKKLCVKKKIDLVFVGPEEPLVNGIYDFLKNDKQLKNIIVIGPSKDAAQLEGSKSFAKSFMNRHKIPTAAYQQFDAQNYAEGLDYIKNHSLPIVLKADGLAAGKGVLICKNYIEAMGEYELMIQNAKFGEAGKKVVVEEFLDGIELSVFLLTDGKNYLLFPEAKDYKRVGENDTGLNTGGMGAISPVPIASKSFMEKVITTIIEPTVTGLQQEMLEYKGFIFIGLIKVNEEPVVIEYNCRMGDPETEVILLRLQNDLVQLFKATSEGRLNEEKIIIDPRHAATIMAVSGGYPGEYAKNKVIEFRYPENGSPNNMNAADGVMVFQAGTKLTDGKTVTNGGRVLTVSALGNTLTEAVDLSKKILAQIYFDGMYYRKDIGHEFINLNGNN